MYKQIKWLRCIKYIISVIFCILPMFFSLHGTFTMAPKRPVPFYLSDAFTRWRKRWPKCAPMMRGVTILLKQYFETVESGSFFVTFEYIVLGKVAFLLSWRDFGAFFSARNTTTEESHHDTKCHSVFFGEGCHSYLAFVSLGCGL